MDKLHSFFTAILILLCISVNAQSLKQNIDFEDGNLNYWDGATGVCCGGGINIPGIVTGRHTVVSGSGTDINTLDSITVVAPTGKLFSVRLGNDNVGSEAELIKRSFKVTQKNANFIYQYAVVLEDPFGHPQNDKPKFEVRIMDSTGTVIPGPCGYYQVTAGPATDTWFKNNDVRFKKWTTVGIDLSAYIGQTMTIQFSTEDCGWGGHFGYAYVDAGYGYLDVIVHGYCEGNDVVQLTGPEGFVKYYWPATQQYGKTISIPKPNEGDSVIVELTNEAGCETKLVHIFEKLPLPHAVAGNDTTLCAGGIVNLWSDGAGTNGTYIWTSDVGGFHSDNQNTFANPKKNTVYTVKVANANGCIGPDSIATVTVIVDTALVFELLEEEQICTGDSVTIVGPNNPGVTYSWVSVPAGFTANSKNIKVSPSVDTKYFLTISNSSCTYVDSSLVKVYSPLSVADTLFDGFCGNDTIVTVEGLSGYSSYQWSSGETTKDVDVLHPSDGDVLTLFLVNSIGCSDSVKYVVSQTSGPQSFAFASNDTVCYGVSVQLNPLGAGVTNFVWTSIPSMVIANKTNPVVTPLVNTKFILQSYNQYGCSDTLLNDTVEVIVDDRAKVSLPNDTTVCNGNSVNLASLSGTGIFSWTSSPSGFISSDSMITVNPKKTTSYFLSISNGACHFGDAVTVNIYDSGLDTLESFDFCQGTASIVLDGPAGFANYKWSSNEITEDITINSPSGSYTKYLYVTASMGCKDTVKYKANEILPSSLQPMAPILICYGNSVQLTASSGYAKDKFQWTSNPVGYSSQLKSPIFEPDDTTTFTVTITNDLNCLANTTQSVIVNVDNSTEVTLGSDKVICKGNLIQLKSFTGKGTYSWTSTPAGFTSSAATINVSPAASTTYHLTISNNYNCSNTDDVSVQVNNLPTPNIAVQEAQYCTGDAIHLNLNSSYSSYD